MPKALSLTVLSSFLLLFLYLVFPVDTSEPPQPNKKVSGAYEALEFFGFSRTYPYKTLPANAHFDAWRRLQKRPIHTSKNNEVAPWETMGPLNISGRTLDLAFNPQNPNTLFAGSASGGLWKSTSAGLGEKAWDYVPTGFPVLGVSTIAFNPGDSMVMYIGTGEVYNKEAAGTGAAYRSTRGSYGMGILKSTDGGNTWTQSLDWSYDQNEGIWDIKVSRQNPSIVYAATTKGVYKSMNAGQTWVQSLNVLMANSLIIHPWDDNKILVACGNFGSAGYGIYKSINGGTNWVQKTNGLPSTFLGKIQLAYAPSAPNKVYASIGNGFGFADGATWICRADDFGETWQIMGTKDYSLWQGWFAHDVAVNPLDPDKIALVGITVWKSNNSGQNLDSLAAGGLGFDSPPIAGPDGPSDYVHSDCHDVIYHPQDSNIFYIAHDGGIHRTTDGGLSFRSLNGGYQTVQFYNGFSTSLQDSIFSLGGLQDNGSIKWDGTPRWTRVFGGDGSWSATDPSNAQTIYISYQRLRMFRSEDQGLDFTYISPPFDDNESRAFIAPFIVAKDNPNRLYAGSTKLYRSDDKGDSWIATGSNRPLDGGNPIFSLDASDQNSQVVYAATAPTTLFGGSRGRVYVSKNGGTSYQDITQNLPDRFPMDIRVDPTNEAVAYISFSGFGTGHLFRTENYGQNWNDISGQLPDVPTSAIEIDPIFPSHLYVGNDLGVFVSLDSGMSWEPFNDGLFDASMIFDLKISPSNRKLRAATHGNGAFQRSLIEGFVGIDDPDEFTLKIGPNPVRSILSVFFELEKAEDMKVEIIDMQGRLVEQLLQDRKGTGIHRLSFNLSHLASGTYYVRLSDKDSSYGKKFVLQK